MVRVLEWDDTRAKYPNVWHEGMPVHLLAYDTVAGRLRLGDLIAVYSPASPRHPERSDRWVGISRVVGLRRAHAPTLFWVDLETAHRFREAVDLPGPRRVFLSADPGWPGPEADAFRDLLDKAVEEGYALLPEETDEGAPRYKPPKEREAPKIDRPAVSPTAELFAGADFSGDMRDPLEATWLAILAREGERLRVVRVEPTGRHGLERLLRDPDADVQRSEAIGLDFPFGLPIEFAEFLLGGPFPEDGWWALARRLEKMTRPEYLTALQDFRIATGEPKRLTDERAGGFSPLHRVNPDLGPMTFHGIRMIAADRSRYAIRPFESAKGHRLLEVYPGATVRALPLGSDARGSGRSEAVLEAVESLERFPIEFGPAARRKCLARRDALDAVLAARAAAVAVISGEADREAAALAPDASDRVRLEGWIYGID